jgi:hypothetical protein
MMDIRQEELDKRFVDGVIAAQETYARSLGSKLAAEDLESARRAVFVMVKQVIGVQRLTAILGENGKEPAA